MKRKFSNNLGLVFSLVLIFVVVIAIFLSIFSVLPKKEPVEFNYSTNKFVSDNIEIYFLPQQEALERVIHLIDDSNKGINCVLRSLNYEELENAFIEKEKQVSVRLFVNEDYMGNKRIYLPFVKFEDRNIGMVHNNYCIIDDTYVVTGSIIFNKNTISTNIHDLIIIKSKELAKEYDSDFWRLYLGASVDNNRSLASLILLSESVSVRPLFCPIDDCESELSKSIIDANKKIGFAVYSFTSAPIIDALREKRELTLKGIIEPYGITQGSIAGKNVQGVVRANFVEKLHTKFFIFDEDLVIAGTMNPSFYGSNYNQENILIIQSKEIASFYWEFLDYLYSAS